MAENALTEEVQAPEPEAPPETPEAPAPDKAPDAAALAEEIEQLRAARAKAEEDAIYWRKQKAEARAEYFKSRQEPAEESKPAPASDKAPNPEDFDTDAAYFTALADHRVALARAQWEQEQSQKSRAQTEREKMEALHQKMQTGFQKYSDFEEVAFDATATHITPMIVQILAECENPADVAYYLAKNRIEGVKISRMSPIAAAREIARLETKLTGQAEPPPPKKTTAAPPPINPLQTGAGSAPAKDPSKMTMAEFRAWREAQGARRF